VQASSGVRVTTRRSLTASPRAHAVRRQAPPVRPGEGPEARNRSPRAESASAAERVGVRWSGEDAGVGAEYQAWGDSGAARPSAGQCPVNRRHLRPLPFLY
jgi:hypothetical protein